MKMTKSERVSAIISFMKEQGTDGIALSDAMNIFTTRWLIPTNLVKKDLKQLTNMGILLLNGYKLYHKEELK